MNIIREYAVGQWKDKTKRNWAMMVSITIATMLISFIVFFAYLMWSDQVERVKKNGDFHGQTDVAISESQLHLIQGNKNVKGITLEKEFESGRFYGARPYLLISSFDQGYWEHLNNNYKIKEGRIPEKKDEIIVSESMLQENIKIHVGDEISILKGVRVCNGEAIRPQDYGVGGESFHEIGKYTVTIVGVFQDANITNYPYYKVAGYFQEKDLNPTEQVYVNIYLKSIRHAYEKLDEIGKNLGLPKTKDGYSISGNRDLLSFYGATPPNVEGSELMGFVLVYTAVIVFTILIFVLMIYNIFEVWANERLKQIGMLKSIGASRGQIRQSILFEASLNSILPIFTGILLSIFTNKFISNGMNRVLSKFNLAGTDEYHIPEFHFHFGVAIAVAAIAYLTVIIAASIPAKRVSKMNIIDALKGKIYEKKGKKHIVKGNNYEKEMRKNNKRSFQATSSAFTIGYIIMFGFLLFFAYLNAMSEMSFYRPPYEMELSYRTESTRYQDVFQEILKDPKVKDYYIYTDEIAWATVGENQLSDEFRRIGFDGSKEGELYDSYSEGDEKKLTVYLRFLDQDKFEKLRKKSITGSVQSKQKDGLNGILVNRVPEDWKVPPKDAKYIPYLNFTMKELEVNLIETDNSSSKLTINIMDSVMDVPGVDIRVKPYQLVVLLSMDDYPVVNQLCETLKKSGQKGGIDGSNYLLCLTMDEDDIIPMREKINSIADSVVQGRDRYGTFDVIFLKQDEQISNMLLKFLFYSFMAFVAFLGSTNAYSAINMNLRSRRGEFAILKSVGLSRRELNQILRKEARYQTVIPVIKAIPIFFIMLFITGEFNERINIKLLLSKLDYKAIFIYVFVLSIFIFLIYWRSSQIVEDEPIVEVLKEG